METEIQANNTMNADQCGLVNELEEICEDEEQRECKLQEEEEDQVDNDDDCDEHDQERDEKQNINVQVDHANDVHDVNLTTTNDHHPYTAESPTKSAELNKSRESDDQAVKQESVQTTIDQQEDIQTMRIDENDQEHDNVSGHDKLQVENHNQTVIEQCNDELKNQLTNNEIKIQDPKQKVEIEQNTIISETVDSKQAIGDELPTKDTQNNDEDLDDNIKIDKKEDKALSSATSSSASSPCPQQINQSQSTQNTQDQQDEASGASLGRNRRVRQKNRYFLDFHCVDLTKGGRTNRDDYDTLTTTSTTTTTRSSNRRTASDQTRTSQDDPEVFETRYCRKCSSKTPHDTDSGCQACLYKKIVESSKRQRPSSQRNKSTAKQQQQQQQQLVQQEQNQQQIPPSQQQQLQHDNGTNNSIESTSTGINVDAPNTNNTSTSGNKRKASKQTGPLTKSANVNTSAQSQINNPTKINNSCSNISVNGINHDCVDSGNISRDDFQKGESDAHIKDSRTNTANDINNQCNDYIDEEPQNKLPQLEAWTPDDVADYILSKGFTYEAELFKTQSVDGISLLLMQRTDFTYGLKIKLGPALKIYDQICRLKKDYFRTLTLPTS